MVGALILEPGIQARTPYAPPSSAADASAGTALPFVRPSDGHVGMVGSQLASLLPSSATADAWHPLRGNAVPLDPAAGDPATQALPGTAIEAVPTPPATPRPRPQTPGPASQPASGSAGAWNVAPIVTWYGPGFYGGRTACGLRYTRHIIGVAHKTLPCGTLVQFRYHGITVTAPVIDRGPYATPDFVFDFSAAVSCDLFREPGQANSCFTRHNVLWRVVGRVAR